VAALVLGVLACAAVASAGHELPFYPGYYPQEIRLERVAPTAAVTLLQKGDLHAYVGADPFADRRDPADLRSVESLGGYVVITFNPAASALSSRDSRCDAARRIAATLGQAHGLYRAHPYPVTPYDPDYLAHFDLLEARKKDFQSAPRGSIGGLRVRAKGPLAEKLLGGKSSGAIGASWDATLEDVDLEEVVAPQRIGVDGWLGPPWLKAGWFHAYLLLAPAITDRATRQAVETQYQRLVSATLGDPTEEANVERSFVTSLVAGCERVVVGYRLQRERFNAEFSQGVENIAYDSQAGFNSAIFLRTVKLKDFPWNGWLKLGLATKATAAWNPIGGFTDPTGRLAWAALGDPAMFPSPYAGSWVDNRVVVASVTMDPAAPVSIPEDALAPEPGTGMFFEVGKGKTARAKVTYRIRASAFHDNTRMTAADAVYAYSFAFRWGARRAQSHDYDSAVEAKTAVLRKALVAFKVVRVETEVKKFSDITFTYVIPVVDVYLDASVADPQTLASFAPPWSPVPWQVLVLMEETVRRGLAAFSADEAKRRGVRWLDLARDPKLREAMIPLLDRFVKETYVPEPLRRFVTADEAQTRWTALKQFSQRRGHFLVTNGPYRLARWSESGLVLEVFRDFTNSMGVGSFDRFAIPRRAYVSRIVPRGGRLEVYPEIERVERFLRDYRIVREPLGRPGTEEDQADVPTCRYVVVSPDGTVAAAGLSREMAGNRLVVNLKDRLKPGTYTVLVALALGDNEMNPEIATTGYRVEGAN
jgi:hypothetical protein